MLGWGGAAEEGAAPPDLEGGGEVGAVAGGGGGEEGEPVDEEGLLLGQREGEDGSAEGVLKGPEVEPTGPAPEPAEVGQHGPEPGAEHAPPERGRAVEPTPAEGLEHGGGDAAELEAEHWRRRRVQAEELGLAGPEGHEVLRHVPVQEQLQEPAEAVDQAGSSVQHGSPPPFGGAAAGGLLEELRQRGQAGAGNFVEALLGETGRVLVVDGALGEEAVDQRLKDLLGALVGAAGDGAQKAEGQTFGGGLTVEPGKDVLGERIVEGAPREESLQLLLLALVPGNGLQIPQARVNASGEHDGG